MNVNPATGSSSFPWQRRPRLFAGFLALRARCGPRGANGRSQRAPPSSGRLRVSRYPARPALSMYRESALRSRDLSQSATAISQIPVLGEQFLLGTAVGMVVDSSALWTLPLWGLCPSNHRMSTRPGQSTTSAVMRCCPPARAPQGAWPAADARFRPQPHRS